MMEVLGEIVKGLIKALWKIFLLLLWGCSRLLESIFHLINNFLKDAIK